MGGPRHGGRPPPLRNGRCRLPVVPQTSDQMREKGRRWRGKGFLGLPLEHPIRRARRKYGASRRTKPLIDDLAACADDLEPYDAVLLRRRTTLPGSAMPQSQDGHTPSTRHDATTPRNGHCAIDGTIPESTARRV